MKTTGAISTLPIECINKRLNKYRVRWDFEPYYNDKGECEGVSFYEAEVSHKPTIDEIKAIIIEHYNGEIDKKILNGFVWDGYQVQLSIENQFNYKAAYDLAFQTNGANLPVKFKFGSTINPSYHTFDTIEDLQSFYISAIKYVENVLSAGWEMKDSLDWSIYDIKY